MSRKRRSRQFKNNSQVINIEDARRQRLDRKKAEREKAEQRERYAASQRTRGKMAIRKSRNRRRFMMAGLVVVVILLLAWSLLGIISLKKEQQDIKAQQEALNREKAQLEQELDKINNPENIEKQARDQLKLIKKGEKLFVFPSELIEKPEEEETEE